jgi:methanol metabolism-related c-type cytochrome
LTRAGPASTLIDKAIDQTGQGENRMLRARWSSYFLVAAVLSLGVQPDARAQDEEEKPYSVVDGKVDQGTYNGYRRYHASCHVCHGPDGMGSSYAPSMVDSLKTMDYVAFSEIVVNGRENVNTASQNVMPAFAMDENVMLHIDDIWAYLRARADGAIGRGRPQRQ